MHKEITYTRVISLIEEGDHFKYYLLGSRLIFFATDYLMYKMLSIWRRQFYFRCFLLLSVSAAQAVGMIFVKLPRPQSFALLASISRASRLFRSPY